MMEPLETDTNGAAPGPEAAPSQAASVPIDVKIAGFTHYYGDFMAVENLNVELPRGTITGFIGPNGAGKTTTILLLATLLRPSRGDATICGYSCTRRRSKVRRMIGYMPDGFGVYEGLSAHEYLRFFAEAYRLPHDRIPKLIDEIVELLNLGEKMSTPVDGLSRGQLQRLSLARTLLHDPQVLILDEPASGLDPIARVELLVILRELRQLGKTLLVSSHILTEIAEVCDRLMIMNRGRLTASGATEEIIRGVHPHFTIEIEILGGGAERAAAILRERGVEPAKIFGDSIEFDFVGDNEELAALHRALVVGGVPLLYFRPLKVTLEQAFAALTASRPAIVAPPAEREPLPPAPGAPTPPGSEDFGTRD